MIAHVYLAKGCDRAEALAPQRADHVHPRGARCASGSARTSEQVVDVGAGEVLHIPPHVPHKADALEDTLDVDVFYPPREDWIDGSDAYLRS